MKRQLFEAVADATQQLLFAANASQALSWCLANNPAFAEAESIMVKRRSDVVDLKEGAKSAHVEPAVRRSPRAERTPPPMPKKRAAAKESGNSNELPPGIVRVHDLAISLGMTTGTLKYKLDKLKVPIIKLRGGGGPNGVNEEIARASLSGKLKGVSKGKPTITRTDDGLGRVASGNQPRFLRIEAVAKDKGMDEGDIEIIKRRGSIKGGFGWIDIDALDAYMASDEYKKSLEA